MNEIRDIERVILDPYRNSFDKYISKLVAFIPKRVTPNQITIFGFIFSIFAAFSFYMASFSKEWFIIAIVNILIYQITDVLDGALARLRNMTSQRGFLLDSFLDSLGMGMFIPLCIGYSTYANINIYLFLVIAYLLTTIIVYEEIVLTQKMTFPFIATFEYKIILIIMSLLTYFWPVKILAFKGIEMGWFDIIGFAGVIFGFGYIFYALVKLLNKLV